MRSWRSLEPTRADHARSALIEIERAPDLSTDVRDIVERTLKRVTFRGPVVALHAAAHLARRFESPEKYENINS